jgi:2,4-dienoyl-CoA reductase-like NADH-dependent reductase (Old Yellow Enzyme family)
MSNLFSELKVRDVKFKNRIFVSPMCQYSCIDGVPNEWHLVHLGSRAVGGAALVMTEATAVSAEGRISPQDTGIWSEEQVNAFKQISAFIRDQGGIPGMQLAHAGRKASTRPPWVGGGPLKENEGAWQTLSASPIPFDKNYPPPQEMTPKDMQTVLQQFKEAARHARQAGFEVLEIHMAHGYLLHQFLSPLSNKRKDDFGRDFNGRIKLPLQVADAVRKEWPAKWPVFVRISCTDWVENGWDLKQSTELAGHLKELGIDLIDCSSGGLLPSVKIPAAPGYQTGFAVEIKRQVGIRTGAVGMITSPVQAEHIITTGQADAVFLAREMLRHPYWPLHAASALGVDISWPNQYKRAKPR